MDDLTRDDLFPPGEYIKDELDVRNWTQEDLSEILGRPLKTVNLIISAKKAITPQTAQELAAAFGTSAELWLNLESTYRLARDKKEQEDVARRARLYDMAPVKDMVRRQWIARCDTVDQLEWEVLRFFRMKSIHDEPTTAAAARKSTSYATMTAAQKAWLFRAKHLASALQVKRFTEGSLVRHLDALHALTADAEEIRRVPGVLADMGIRFVVVEHLPRTRIDGAALWLDDKSPVIALSLRHGRIDAFWHTLAHELMHVKNRDGDELDNDLVGDSRQERTDELELQTDQDACDFLIPCHKLESFIARVRPRFSKARIVQFAGLHQIHAGIVVGQLQYRGEIKYSHSREMLVSVREIIVDAALTDGWGIYPDGV